MPVEPIGPVVVGVDGSPRSMAAVYLAAEEAMGRVTPLVVVHALDDLAEAVPAEQVARWERARRLTAAAVAEALAAHPGLSVSARLVPGDPVWALVHQSRDACLLVVGHHHRQHHGHGATTTGDVAERLMSQAAVPVIVHRPLDATGHLTVPRPVLVGVDCRADDQPTVEFAFAEASLRGASLVALHVWWQAADTQPAGIGLDAFDVGKAGRETEATLAGVVARWADKYPDVAVTYLVRHGLDVPVALTAASHTAQLVVVGSTGSVAGVLLRRAGCSVAAVPCGKATTSEEIR